MVDVADARLNSELGAAAARSRLREVHVKYLKKKPKLLDMRYFGKILVGKLTSLSALYFWCWPGAEGGWAAGGPLHRLRCAP
jgi:hypothetical protein